MNTNLEIRAVLLKEYGWDIDEKNELFPFIKLIYHSGTSNREELRLLKNVSADLNKKLDSQRMVQNKFENGMAAFLYGFGKTGLAMCLVSLLIFILVQTNTTNGEATKIDKAYDNLLTNFIAYSKKRNPEILKLLQDDFNYAPENNLKIKFFPDSSLGVGKSKIGLTSGF